jgi:hypothetical protein
MVNTVIALYLKGGRKNGKHTAVLDVINIARVFLMLASLLKICIVSSSDQSCQQKSLFPQTYLLLPSTTFLCMLSTIPQVKNNNLEIHAENLQTYDILEDSLEMLEAKMKLFTKWWKGKVVQEIEGQE